MIDGSADSLGGNGALVPPPANLVAFIQLAPVVNTTWDLNGFEHTGGGCVTTGPFANWTVPFGPIGPNITDSMRDNPDKFRYKPHCLTRNFGPIAAAESFTQTSHDALLQSANISEFNQRFSDLANPNIPTIFNLHGKGHQGMS